LTLPKGGTSAASAASINFYNYFNILLIILKIVKKNISDAKKSPLPNDANFLISGQMHFLKSVIK
jgi:hypothetical protein